MRKGLDVESEAVFQFVKDLRRYGAALEGDTQKVAARLGQLGGSWRDQKYRNFTHDVAEITSKVRKAREVVDMYAGHLESFARQVKIAEEKRVGRR